MLDTPAAKLVLDKLVEGGLLNDDYTLAKGISNSKAYIMAICIMDALQMERNYWEPFEELWHIDRLRTYQEKATSAKYYVTFEEKIKEILKEL